MYKKFIQRKLLLGSLVMVAVFGLVALCPQGAKAAVVVTSPTTIFSDGFESGDFRNWTFSNSHWSVTGENAYDGSYKKAQVNGDTGTIDDSVVKVISTSGYNSIMLSYAYRLSGLDASDSLIVEWSTDHINWNILKTYSNNTANMDWISDSVSLPANASNNENFRFRFRAHINNGSEIFYLDNVALTGLQIPSAVNSTVTVTTPISADGAQSSIVINLKDSSNNPIVGMPADKFTVEVSGDGNVVIPVSAATDSAGRTTALVSSTIAGQKTVKITVDGVVLNSQPLLTVNPGVAANATITANPGTTIEANLSGASVLLGITVTDGHGNLVKNDTVVNMLTDLGTISGTGNTVNGIVNRTLSYNNKGTAHLSFTNLAEYNDSIIYFVDTTKPLITRLGMDPVSVEYKEAYTDTGASAYDNIDGDISSSIITTNPVDTNVINKSVINPADKIVSVYTVKYNVKDSSNNSADEVTRTVNVVDTTAPVISSITSNATASGALKIGDKIKFTLTPATSEPGASVSGSYNGHPLVWLSADDGVTYTAEYTVIAGDLDQVNPLQITGVTITDEAANVSLPVDGCDMQKTIDANAPAAPVVDLLSYINIAGQASVQITFSGEVGATLNYTISDSNTPATILTGSGVVDAAGSLIINHNLSSLVDGVVTVVATLQDAAGNISNAGSDTANKDTLAPLAPAPVLPIWINTNNQDNLTITGTGEAAADIKYTISDLLDNKISGTAKVSAAGTINISGVDVSTLQDGAIIISMTLIDAAGNEGVAGSANSTKETVKPILVSIDSDSKIYKAGEYDISATFSEAVNNPKIAIAFSNLIGTCTNILASTMTSTADQKVYTYHLTVDNACDAATGTITISDATDVAGNIIQSDSSHTFGVDTLAPVFSATTPVTDSYIKADFSVTYTLSEDLSAGTISFQASPVNNYALAGAQLSAGVHTITAAELAAGGIVMVDGSTYSIIFNGTDLVGNNAVTVTNTGIKYDTTVPTVIDVTSTKADGAYKAGENIVITVKFSEPVNASGTDAGWSCGMWYGSHCSSWDASWPAIILETGDTDRTVNYSSGSGTDTLTFNYTVQAGDINPDLDYISENALNLNGQTINDLAGNGSNLTLPAPGATHSLGGNKNIVIDTIAPVISVHTDLIAEATSGAGAVVEYALPTANDSVNGAVEVSCLPASASQFALGNTTITCTAADALGNTATSQFNVIVRDTTAPTITAPADIDMPANGWLSTVVLGTPTVSDAVDSNPVVTNDAPTAFPVGTTMVTWTVKDFSGNSATAIQNVTVEPAVIVKLDVYGETPRVAGQNSLITINGKDQYGHITTNQSRTIVVISADNGGSLSESIVTLQNGEAKTNLTKNIAGTVNVSVSSGILTPKNTQIVFTAADIEGPQVTEIYPEEGKTDVSINSPLFIIFNEPIKSESVTSNNIKLMKVGEEGDEVVPAMVSLSEGDLRVNINPDISLDYESEYYFIVSGVTDKTGNVMADTVSAENSGFTTAQDVADHIAPTVVAAWPTGSGVAVNVKPYIDFSETMKLSSLTEENIRLFKLGDSVPVAAAVVVQNGGTRVEIQPVLNLEYETDYYVVVSDAVTDEAGNNLASVYTSENFSTVAEEIAELAVTNIANLRSWAVAGGGFTQGWKWRFDITVPSTEDNFYMRFNDWTNGTGGTIAAANNIRYYSAQGDHDSSNPIVVTDTNYPDTALVLNSDLDENQAGRQIQVYVEVQVPENTAGGSYSTSYQVKSLGEIDN